MVSISYFRNLWLKVGDKRIGHRTILRPLAVILTTAPLACAQSSVVDQKTSLRAANRQTSLIVAHAKRHFSSSSHARATGIQ
jgi:hypothetical protein